MPTRKISPRSRSKSGAARRKEKHARETTALGAKERLFEIVNHGCWIYVSGDDPIVPSVAESPALAAVRRTVRAALTLLHQHGGSADLDTLDWQIPKGDSPDHVFAALDARRECRRFLEHLRQADRYRWIRSCTTCGHLFYADHDREQFCSPPCWPSRQETKAVTPIRRVSSSPKTRSH